LGGVGGGMPVALIYRVYPWWDLQKCKQVTGIAGSHLNGMGSLPWGA
jgi:hypothetical protein